MNCRCCFSGESEPPLCAPCEEFRRVERLYLSMAEKHSALHSEAWDAIKAKTERAHQDHRRTEVLNFIKKFRKNH